MQCYYVTMLQYYNEQFLLFQTKHKLYLNWKINKANRLKSKIYHVTVSFTILIKIYDLNLNINFRKFKYFVYLLLKFV